MENRQVKLNMTNRSLLPTVSIGIPTYNRVKSLRRAIESATRQDYPNLEIIVSDNASTDETRQVCEDLAVKDPRIRYFCSPENQGPTANFIEVLNRATGDYFMWLGDDDWVDSNYVSCCLRALMDDPELVLVGGSALNYRNGKFISRGKAINLGQRSRYLRVLRYYAKVGDNVAYYGLMPTADALRVPLTNTMGGDWLFIAGMVYLGKTKMLSAINIHRERCTSTSSNKRNIARTLRLPRYQAITPYLSIAVSAARDVWSRNPVFHDNRPIIRSLFALCILAQVIFSKAIIANFKHISVSTLISIFGEQEYRRVREMLRYSARQ